MAGSDRSRFTVLLALLANAGVAMLKLVAGLLSGSGALLSEAAHSAGDTSTQILLLTAVRRSERPADQRHPFGYGKERYFWSLLAAFGILVSGAVFSLYEGVHTIISPHEQSAYVWVNYVVLAIAFVMEGTSLVQATRQVRDEAEEHEHSMAAHLRGTDDPAPRAVFTEDLAAVIGIVLAAAGVGLHQLTGSAVWDGIASILIGVLLAVVAVLLGRVCKGLLIGRQADPRLVRAVWEHVERQPEVDDLVDVQTMLTGTDKVLVCARVDFIDNYSAGDVEQACIRIDNELRELFHDVDEVFIQPVPRTNADLRQRVLQRYGRVLTD
ncbi:cation diffusion facilitator family transporter [Lentzea flava]|uniref:Cation diffusion facilitator transporter n=1 Tax=Lentzea flava TaxID=103732 RepID=A0ABQ2UBG8_9PSEU|nr:cation diffusion facilitator family transporter [Lentzea flava]MCP2196486.1 cation diffusion facilitator family transporter [Lentzea flava]GGU17567.1 cation diffusion facilitator transporter [Lentzea flava]